MGSSSIICHFHKVLLCLRKKKETDYNKMNLDISVQSVFQYLQEIVKLFS